MKALLIIDMQKGCFESYDSKYNTLGVIDNINKLSAKFRELGYLVINIAHDGTKENYLLPTTSDFEFLPELLLSKSDIYITKEANDAFYKTRLEKILKERGIHELFICGQASNYCIDCSVKVALHKGYKINIASDAHTTKSAEGIEAETLVKYYNWLWSNLTPTRYIPRVIPTQIIIDAE